MLLGRSFLTLEREREISSGGWNGSTGHSTDIELETLQVIISSVNSKSSILPYLFGIRLLCLKLLMFANLKLISF